MIDDPAEVSSLMKALEASLPLPARPARHYLQNSKRQNVSAMPDRELFIESVLYMGDEGGISCIITPNALAGERFVVSITHLEFAPDHPLTPRIISYQTSRTRNIICSQRHDFSSMLPAQAKRSRRKNSGFSR